MALRRRPRPPENHERWLVSYADFITLLFAFFVVMFASSQTDRSKARQMSSAVRNALENGSGMAPSVARILGGTVDDKGIGNAQMRGPGGAQHTSKEPPGENTAELLPSMQRLSSELQDELKLGKVEMKLEPRGLVISLKQATFFPSGGDDIAPETYSTVNKLAEMIRSLPNPIQLEGHTDAQPIHNSRFRSNWELSAARAIAMLELLHEHFDISPDRFAVVGRADTSPVDSNETEEGRRRNRRVDIVIVNMHEPVNTKPSPVVR